MTFGAGGNLGAGTEAPLAVNAGVTLLSCGAGDVGTGGCAADAAPPAFSLNLLPTNAAANDPSVAVATPALAADA
jgi:hypothetical protein